MVARIFHREFGILKHGLVRFVGIRFVSEKGFCEFLLKYLLGI